MFKVQIDPESRDFRKGSLFSLTGFALQILGTVADIPYQLLGFTSIAAMTAIATGALLFVIGVFYLARSKNRSPAWAALGLFALVGFIIVAFLEDRAGGDGEDAVADESGRVGS